MIEKQALKETSCMVSVDAPLAVLGDVPEDALEHKRPHFTLAYVRLSDDVTQRTEQMDLIKSILDDFCLTVPPIQAGVLSGADVFHTEPPTGKTFEEMGETPNAVVCRRPSPGFFGWLFATSNRLQARLESAGLSVSRFAKFQPHITLKIVPDAEFTAFEAAGGMFDYAGLPEVTFPVNDLHLHRYLDEHYTYPLKRSAGAAAGAPRRAQRSAKDGVSEDNSHEVKDVRVFVYWNLHKGCWSLKSLEGPQKSKVIAHRNSLVLENCEFRVSEAGRQRVLREKSKNVHAGVVGTWTVAEQTTGDSNRPVSLERVSYNPYKGPTFVRKSDNTPVSQASRVEFGPNAQVGVE